MKRIKKSWFIPNSYNLEDGWLIEYFMIDGIEYERYLNLYNDNSEWYSYSPGKRSSAEISVSIVQNKKN